MLSDLELWLRFGIPIGILIIAYVVGTILERRHFKSIRAREAALKGYPVTTFETLPDDWQVSSMTLASGNVVVSLDYFKRIIAGLRALFGGRITTYEPLLDRARREALLRMTESARNAGYDAVINVRLEMARLASARGDGNGTAGIELVAYGTALKFDEANRFAR